MTTPPIDRAAELIANAWQPALAASYRLGYVDGHRDGHAAGAQDEGDAWTAIITGWAAAWRRPRYAELEKRREPDYEPCAAGCGACSRCFASEAYWSRSGRPYLGVEREGQMASRSA